MLGDEVAHFGEVAQAEVGNSVAVGYAMLVVSVEHRAPVVVTVFVQQVVQHFAILVARVHAFAVKRHYGVGGIAEEGGR